MKLRTGIGLLALLAVMASGRVFGEVRDSPQAPARTFAQNYRDMVLATCIATAYKDSNDAAIDAGSSVSALRDWTYYDLDKSPQAVESLVRKFLSRDYHNPLVEAEVKGIDIRFDFLKCLDLYHSKDLDRLVKQLVLHPNDTIRSRTRREKY